MTEQNSIRPANDPAGASVSSLAGQVEESVMAELLSIRSSIDNIDATLVYLLAERFKATQKVGILKAAHNLPAGDPGRETAQITRLRRLAAEANLDPAFAEKFLNFIIGEVIRHHEAIAVDHQAARAAGTGSPGTVPGSTPRPAPPSAPPAAPPGGLPDPADATDPRL